MKKLSQVLMKNRRHISVLSDQSSLSSEQQQIFKSAQEFGRQKILPFITEWDKNKYFPKEIVKQSADYGFGGIYTSSDFGGCDLGRLEASLIFEAIAESSVNISAYISIHNMNCWLIDQYASDYIKNKYLNYCLTEPNSGSDAASMQTTARKEGDDYILNGSKVFISGGGMSDVYIIMCKTSEKGISAFIVEKDTKGLSFGKNESKMGWHCSPTTMVLLDECRIPASNLIGSVNQGFKYAMSALDGGRVNIASTSLGAANYCLQQAMDHVKQRKQVFTYLYKFGKKLQEFQYTQFKIADIATQLISSQLMIRNAARMMDSNNPEKTVYCAMAKKYGTDNCFNIVNECLQLFGGYGYLSDYQIERYLRDIRVNQILEGTNEIMRLIISRKILSE